MLRGLKKKRVLAALGLVAMLTVTGVAFAYFSASGAGSGNAQVGTSTALTINPTITPGAGGIVPGGNPASISLTVNNGGSGKQNVGTVTMTGVQAYSDAAHTTNITGSGAGKCDTTQFSMTPVAENQQVPTGGPTALANNGSLVFADSGSNQDGCKGAYLVASFTSN
ncbi:MAG: hypothetical protein ACRDNK_17410 [Solirubrobacteraceae bacterium]